MKKITKEASGWFKKSFVAILSMLLLNTAYSQVKISELPVYTGTPTGVTVPVVVAGINRKMDGYYFASMKIDSVWFVGSTLYVKKNGVTVSSSHTHPQSQITNLADSLLARYTKTQIDALLALKLNLSDTAAMVSNYIKTQRVLDSLTAVQARIQTKQPLLGYTPENVSNKATDFTTINNTLYPTVQAAKNYADGLVVGLLNDRGNYDASSNVFPSSGGSGTSGAIMKGNMWYISVTGTLGTTLVNLGDWIRALTDAPGQTAGNWGIVNAGLGFTPENNANKSNNTSLGTSTTLYPTQNAVKVYTDAAVTNGNTAYSNRIATFTTTGSSGAATFASNVLNIPNYTLAGLGGISAVSGTTSRITVSGGTTIDISSAYVGQTSITTLGTITTGVWNAGAITINAASPQLTLNKTGGGNNYIQVNSDDALQLGKNTSPLQVLAGGAISYGSIPAMSTTPTKFMVIDNTGNYLVSYRTSSQLLSDLNAYSASNPSGYLSSVDTSNISNFSYKVRTRFSATGPLAISNGGVISMPAAYAEGDGYLSQGDWNTFNNKEPAQSGTGFVKKSGYTTSYDNNTYYKSGDNPSFGTGTFSGNITATSGYVNSSFGKTLMTVSGSSPGSNYFDLSTLAEGTYIIHAYMNQGGAGVNTMYSACWLYFHHQTDKIVTLSASDAPSNGNGRIDLVGTTVEIFWSGARGPATLNAVPLKY